VASCCEDFPLPITVNVSADQNTIDNLFCLDENNYIAGSLHLFLKNWLLLQKQISQFDNNIEFVTKRLDVTQFLHWELAFGHEHL